TSTVHKQVGTGYSLLGDTKFTINHTAIQNGKAILEITCSGIWVYQFSQSQQHRLIHLIAGKPKGRAIQLLLSMQGIQAVSITGIGESASVPGEINHIQIIVS